MTGAQILAAFEALGAVVRLTPAGVVEVETPDAPELEKLVAEVKANRADVVAELRRHVPLFAAPGRDERPCLACGRQCPEGVLFDTGECFEAWRAERRALRAAGAARRDTAGQGGQATGPRAS